MKKALLHITLIGFVSLTLFIIIPRATFAQTATCVGTTPKECFPLPGSPSSYTWTSYLQGACLDGPSCMDRAEKDHLALDIGAAEGTAIFAPWDGVVELAESPPGSTTCGGMVMILHSSVNKRSYMCHFQRTSVQAGQTVSAGSIVGYADNSGRSHGSHLHIQILDTLSGAPLREQQVSALPAFRGINSGGIAGGADGKPIFITASGGVAPNASDIKLALSLTWPRLPGTEKSLNELVEGAAKIYVQNIVNFIFILSLWIGAITAFISIVYAGFTYIISGANPGERSRAIQGIKNTVIGIGILLASVTILNFINPNLSQLELSGYSLGNDITGLRAPNAPTASGGLLKNTINHPYAPIPYTDRTGTEDTYAAIIQQSEDVRNCFKKSGPSSPVCTKQYEKELADKFKSAGAIIVKDDDATPVSCAAICMKFSGNDPLNCRQYGSGGTEKSAVSGGAKSIWEKLNQEPWQQTSEGYYGENGSPYNSWLEDDSGVPGDEDLQSRQCLAQYVSDAIDAPGDFRWDACFCNSNP